MKSRISLCSIRATLAGAGHRAETDRLFAALAVNGKVEMPLQDKFWGAYFGRLTDQFGVQWMFNCT